MSNFEPREISVWDPLVRLFHWLLVVGFCVAYVSQGDVFERLQDRLDGELVQLVHVWAGYTIAGLLAIRLIWGFVGPRYARFSDFVHPPRVVAAYVRDVLTLRARRHLGHNPAGGAMIVFLLLGLLLTIVSGVALYGADKGLGPLAGWLAESSESTVEFLEEVHEVATNGMLLLIAGHLLGVLWESILHRENLVRSMFTGRKRP
ncbi:MAG TPA: cytochrome b/b6 domain-containing protein [Accumulibacter sp.]|uniref:cytochrome b/b6 domain-containing protein n=1 Tax=Accumulibacter sp. TaxID=2053492 RepID=UPI0026215F93|nr:cytochrome b/b6 domain-containing protein [Accumulibacter sp.]MDS4055379.1 cytochrome b/b6 domain-containing protein [Accumulibacter sp.]HMV05607.1 cytochrome b/b6 domain-containing protein [Accumulibacter sp.]HMW63547.1 cytochrome b/b6 domain-containing protein [Accumulibacter sp.]HMW80017.1 cytochrome b/b6 domain-containing protein [Accumulibacter sp.]HMX67932.1 cytochrome b/b6 domain-containing protein [Accumulibacter sp.]